MFILMYRSYRDYHRYSPEHPLSVHHLSISNQKTYTVTFGSGSGESISNSAELLNSLRFRIYLTYFPMNTK